MTRPTPFSPDDLSPHARLNRQSWNKYSAEYQAEHGPQLAASGGYAWGVWQIPEDELLVLGDVAGKDILELGCGAAQWSIALARRGARPVGLDLSEAQLQHARRLMKEARVTFPLVHASAEAVPLPDASFDVVFCDWGAVSFTDPDVTVPEVVRLLRPGGLFAFSGTTPFYEICTPVTGEHPGEILLQDYFGLKTRVDDEWADFTLPYGAWVRLFRRHGLLIEDLIELRPADQATSTYRSVDDHAWALRWPMEQIWKVRKPASGEVS